MNPIKLFKSFHIHILHTARQIYCRPVGVCKTWIKSAARRVESLVSKVYKIGRHQRIGHQLYSAVKSKVTQQDKLRQIKSSSCSVFKWNLSKINTKCLAHAEVVSSQGSTTVWSNSNFVFVILSGCKCASQTNKGACNCGTDCKCGSDNKKSCGCSSKWRIFQ